MSETACGISRRGFLQRAALGLGGTLVLPRVARGVVAQSLPVTPSPVGLIHGDSRADNVFRALKLIEPQVREALAKKKRVVIKPNLVVTNKQLAATHSGCIEGLLEFFQPLVQEEILVAESPANGPAAEAYDNYGFHALEKNYRVRFADLDSEPFRLRYLVSERHHPKPVRLSELLVDPEVFVVSAAVMKTHDRVVTTLGLKNVAVGGILKDTGYRWGAGSTGTSDKHLVHGGPKNEGIHFNLFDLAADLHPDLTVLDGFEGMEGNGPTSGTPVDHRIAVASTDWLAADRVGIELMGFDFQKVGYLTFCAQAGMGQADLGRIEVLGERVADHVRAYRPHDGVEEQYKWM